MINLGRVRPGSTIYIPFETFAGATGAPITLTGLATSDIQVYKDGGTTQRASASGFTLLDTDGIDFDGITGIHGFSIDLSDNTTADFWAAGSRYFVVVSTVTVDSQTMSFIAATFSIGYEGSWIDTYIATLASQTSFTLNAGPAEDDALNGHWAIIHDAASAVQSARVLISDYTGASKTVTLASGATFTAAAKDNISIMGMAPLQPATLGRQPVVDASGLVDANTVKVGPTGSGTAQTARDIGASVLLSSGTGTGQLNFTGGVVQADSAKIGGQTASASGTVTFPNATLASTTNITAGTITTVGTLTGHTPQTGDSYARIGAAGAGLTALGDTRLANLDAAISSRMATFTYTAPDNTNIGNTHTIVSSVTYGNEALLAAVQAGGGGGGGAGGGILNARIANSSLAPNQYLLLIQGEEKIITFIVEADGRFDNQSATAISVKLADPEGNMVTKGNADVDRITEELDVQVFRTTLSPADTATLSEGLLRIEIAFDTQKAVLTHSLKVVEAL